MKTENMSLRKGAILISSLDPRSADALLDQMDEELAARVRRAAMELGDVPREEEERVIREFLQAGSLTPSQEHPGIELDDSLVQRFSASEERRSSTTTPAAPAEKGRFHFLDRADGEAIAPLLANESPQIVAVVLANLPPQRAADVLQRLPLPMQTEVIRRLSDLDATDPEILREVEEQLGHLLQDHLHRHQRRSKGMAIVKDILAAAGSQNRDQLLAGLASRDQHLAEQITGGGGGRRVPPLHEVAGPEREKADAPASIPSIAPRKRRALPKDWKARHASNSPANPWLTARDDVFQDRTMASHSAAKEVAESVAPPAKAVEMDRPEPETIAFSFAELEQLDVNLLARVFRRVSPQVAILALAGAPPALSHRIESQLPPREAAQWRRKFTALGPLRLRDVEHAQQQVAAAAVALIREESRNSKAEKTSFAYA